MDAALLQLGVLIHSCPFQHTPCNHMQPCMPSAWWLLPWLVGTKGTAWIILTRKRDVPQYHADDNVYVEAFCAAPDSHHAF
jgi:hypothetical protein